MGVSLSKEDLQNIQKFRYKTNPLTPFEVMFYDPYWNFLANYCLPDWLAPNALTLMGIIFPMATLIVLGYLDPSMTLVLPGWVWLLSWFGDSWY